MADETTKAPKAMPKGFKLAKGAAMDLRGVNFKVTNELLKNPNVIAVIQRNCPEAFSEGLIVPA